MQELVWQIAHNVDIETSKKVSMQERSPFLELQGFANEKMIQARTDHIQDPIEKERIVQTITNSVDEIDKMASPRIIKTHLPLEMLPPNLLTTCKVIFVCRNPKDTCVSDFNHCLKVSQSKMTFGSFGDFSELFMAGQVEYGNYWHMLKVLH